MSDEQKPRDLVKVLRVDKLDAKESAYKAPSYQEVIDRSDESVKRWYQYLTAAASSEQKIMLIVLLIRDLMSKYNLSSQLFANVSYEVIKKRTFS